MPRRIFCEESGKIVEKWPFADFSVSKPLSRDWGLIKSGFRFGFACGVALPCGLAKLADFINSASKSSANFAILQSFQGFQAVFGLGVD